jgi:Ca2+/H+ antiporter, TMEM165/GDT1 family
MEWKIFGTAFLTLFLAELGDKTQLAVIMLTAKTESKLAVFLGASAALVIVSLIAVLVGGVLSQYVPTEWLQRIVAVAFIAVGVLMLFGQDLSVMRLPAYVLT